MPTTDLSIAAPGTAEDGTEPGSWLSPLLVRLASAAAPSAAERARLLAAAGDDPVQSAFALEGNPAATVLAERIELLPRIWPPFQAWWQSYFAGESEPPICDLWRLYLPFAQWIVRHKRLRRPDTPFMVGFNGSPGAGKTVLTTALAVVLDELLDRDREGRAVARSGDDWYLGKAERESLRARGYDPGLPGVSNRSLPGTHDLAWLERNLREIEASGPDSVIQMGNFDKRADDQPVGADRYFEVRGKVGVFLFDLWFAGAETEVDPMRLPAGLRRAVAAELVRWRGVFSRLDALWAFEWPSFEQMVRDREAQERLVEQRRGSRGMSAEQLRAFMSYMVEHSWDWQLTSPVPPPHAVTFTARRGPDHRVIQVRRGGRAS